MRSLLKGMALLATASYLAGTLPAQPLSQNMALGKTYQLDPAPNYKLCTDGGDRTQLTDGQYVEGYFWTQEGTVGWSGQSPVLITIDLEQPEPIGGVSFNTAAGVAGVFLPGSIWILVSEDGQTWRQAGDLAALDRMGGAPTSSGYALHRFHTLDLKARGRFVKLLVAPTGAYAFVDEIEVYRGPDAWLNKPMTGPVITDVRAFFDQCRMGALLRRRLSDDLAAVTEAWQSVHDPPAIPDPVRRELDHIREAIPDVTLTAAETFTTVFPIGRWHERIFAVQAALWRASGLRGTMLWQNNRWDMLSPTAKPQPGQPTIAVAMMNNEYRSAAFNLSHAGESLAGITLVVSGLPGGDNPDYITVHEVPFTDTQSGLPVAAALPYAKKTSGRYELQIHPGCTCQLWLTFHPRDLTAGEYTGKIRLQVDGGADASVPIALKIYPISFPDRPTLHLGGWDYTDRDRCYEVTPENRPAFLEHLREHFVDSPWAQSAVLARGKHDPTGRMIEPPDPSQFRTWLDRWPEARNYYVFASVGDHFAGFRMGTPAFRRAVSDWITWWVNQLQQWNVQPGQLGLLLVDEPHQREQDRIIIEYAKVIRTAQPEVIIWEDPTWRDPAQATPELFELSHVLCPNLPMWIAQGPSFADFYIRQRQAGRRLWFYSCSGPGRLLDPYSYHRMQHWYCWKYGAEGSGFWAFGDSNGASSWNEYASQIGAYTPLFLDRTSVTPGKHMEAIREGIEDYEYLRMLRDQVEQLEKTGFRTETVSSARRLLDTAADRVTSCMTNASLIHWQESKDRSTADQVRVEILDLLARLKEVR